MTWFFLGAAALLLAATLVFVLRPLLRDPRAPTRPQSPSVNAAVVKDQLDELERDHASGAIADREYDEAKLELKRRLLEDAGGTDNTSRPASRRAPTWPTVIVAASIPVVAIGLYLALGTPGAINPPPRQARAGPAEIEAMVQRLARRLEQKPDDPQGWVMLARSYKVLGRYAESAAAYGKVENVVLADVRLIIDYAEAIALAQGGSLQGKPSELAVKALALDPNYPQALMLAGAVQYQQGDYAGAVRYWQQARAKVASDPESAKALDGIIAKARSLGALPPEAQAVPPSGSAARGRVAGTVRLAQGLASKAAPTDTVFIFARATSGTPAPLAVMRKQVKDLPVEFALDDSMAMAPNLKISGFPEVIVGARVSRSGNAMPQRGDLQGHSKPVRVGATDVAVVIDTALP